MTKKKPTRAELNQILIELDAVLASTCTNAAAMCINLAHDYEQLGVTDNPLQGLQGAPSDLINDVLMESALLEIAETLTDIGDRCAQGWRALAQLPDLQASRDGMLQLSLALLTQPGQTGAAGVASAARGGGAARSKVPR